MTSPTAQWRVGYDAPNGERKQLTTGAFDELVISAAGIHVEVLCDGTEPGDEACIDVHIGALHLWVSVDAKGKRVVRLIDGKFVDGMLVEGT